jgi:hypothetical protein
MATAFFVVVAYGSSGNSFSPSAAHGFEIWTQRDSRSPRSIYLLMVNWRTGSRGSRFVVEDTHCVCLGRARKVQRIRSIRSFSGSAV